MSSNAAKTILIISGALLLGVAMWVWRPDYFTSTSGLATLIGAQLLLAAIANYRRAFFPVLFLCFLLAGCAVPFKAEFGQARWPVLGVGSVIGLAVYMKTHSHTFRLFHFIAACCVLSGFVSAYVSSYPSESVLKAVSLFLMLLYAAAGARVAASDASRFFRRLVRAAEILVVVAATCYLVFRWELFGNPNSLGVIMAVVIIPLLLWGRLTAQSRPERLRLNGELLLGLLLLLSSFARASIAAAAVSAFMICWSAREFRLMVKGVALAMVLAVCVVLFMPRHTDAPTWDGNESISSLFLYKGRRDAGVFGSRRTVWQKTWSVIREKPWFGSGFGTSEVDGDMTKLEYAQHHVDSWVIREHGNSYLAITEWTGLLGVVPFFFLVILLGVNAGKTFLFLRRTCSVSSPATVAAAIVVAGLIHATFEDWLFAVGNYICVFFWSIAFISIDLTPAEVVVCAPESLMVETPPGYNAVAVR